ncbi:MAG: hypothetical protein Q8P86_01480 [bacterium]|nr:hypothetical protein [bacterium]
MDTVTTIGTIGAGIILVFFLLNQAHKIDRDSMAYDVGNFIGGGLLVVYSIFIQSWPFLALNIVWTLFSFKDMFLNFKKRHF